MGTVSDAHGQAKSSASCDASLENMQPTSDARGLNCKLCEASRWCRSFFWDPRHLV